MKKEKNIKKLKINKRDRDRYNKITDEEKQKHRKKYKDLSEEQKQKKKRLSKTIYRKHNR